MSFFLFLLPQQQHSKCISFFFKFKIVVASQKITKTPFLIFICVNLRLAAGTRYMQDYAARCYIDFYNEKYRNDQHFRTYEQDAFPIKMWTYLAFLYYQRVNKNMLTVLVFELFCMDYAAFVKEITMGIH